MLPALALGALFFFTRQGAGNGGGGGGGLNGGDVPAGMASVGGGIAGVSLSHGAQMGQVDKTTGATIVANVRIDPNTTRGGQAIVWPYYIIVRIGHSTVFGWRTAGASGIPSFGNIVFPWASTQRDIISSETILLPIMRAPDDPNQIWDVHVVLRAQESDAAGNPNGTWMNLGSEFREDGAIRTVSASNPALVGGSIDRVGVGQLPPVRQPLPNTNRRGLRLTGRG